MKRILLIAVALVSLTLVGCKSKSRLVSGGESDQDYCAQNPGRCIVQGFEVADQSK